MAHIMVLDVSLQQENIREINRKSTSLTLGSLPIPASSKESSDDLRLDWKLFEFARRREVLIGSGVTLIVRVLSAENELYK